MKKIEAEPVKVEMVDAEGLKKLRANDTQKVLLVNFWATWCGPCLTEFPEIENTWRMFRRRDFDLVMVAANLPDERAGRDADPATGARVQPQSAVRDGGHLRPAGGVRAEVGGRRAVHDGDRARGKVIFQQQGEVDVLALRRVFWRTSRTRRTSGHPDYWKH